MTGKIVNAWEKTAGKKTASSGVLLLLFQLAQLINPNIMTPEWRDWTYNAIGVVGMTGVLDKLWRNRQVIINKVKNVLKKGGNDGKFEKSVE